MTSDRPPRLKVVSDIINISPFVGICGNHHTTMFVVEL